MTDTNKDFAGNRLVPFCIGLAASIAIGIIGSIFYGLMALIFAIGAYGAHYGNGAGVAASFIIGIPLVTVAVIFAIALWLLTTWLLGRWVQEKCRNYAIKRSAERAANDKIRAQAMQEAEKRAKEEALWEAEWAAMKRGETQTRSS